MDTSSLIKLYHNEEGTDKLDKIFTDNVITEIFISEIAKTEFFSAIYKKRRTKELLLQRANDILNAFTSDEGTYTFVLIKSAIINASQKLIEKHGVAGLRALDSIQLASACSIGNLIDMAISGDKLLNSFFLSEGIPIL
ncbi:MAG: type II toxin-antitoxin system VapC family toxin [Sphingobacteriales bacterium]